MPGRLSGGHVGGSVDRAEVPEVGWQRIVRTPDGARHPVLGALPRYLRALVYLPRMQRDIEELRGLIAMHKNALDDRDRAIVDFQNEQLANIVRHLDR